MDCQSAETYLSQADAVMAGLVAKHGPCRLGGREYQPFQTLVTAIISQQISTKAAATIKGRMLALVAEFTPAALASVSPDALRSAGLSGAKARYILELARRANDRLIDFDALQTKSDDDALATLVALPGIGRWTAEMFLMSSLNRPDILSLGDAGLQRAVRVLYGEGADLTKVAEAWRPYRSAASWYLWRAVE
jgi:DNA-3-methyladenine glycosylase II